MPLRFAAILCLSAAFLVQPLRSQSGVPAGWRSCGSERSVSTDTAGAFAGKRSLVLVAPFDTSAACVAQGIDAAAYRGHWIRLHAMLRGQMGSRFGGLWMRVVGSSSGPIFDTMSDRHNRLGLDWRPFHVTLFVPPEATAIQIGATVVGANGALWLDDLRLEFVSDTATTTTVLDATEPPVITLPLLSAPLNLSFEE